MNAPLRRFASSPLKGGPRLRPGKASSVACAGWVSSFPESVVAFRYGTSDE